MDDDRQEAGRDSERPKNGSDGPDSEFRARKDAQVRLVEEASEGQLERGFGSGAGRERADVSYLCRRGVVLVRDADLARVQASLSGTRVDDPGIDGLTRVLLPPNVDVAESCRQLDEAVGVGVATPDHLLWVAPRSYGCPATEPEEPRTNLPLPPVSHFPDSGRGVMVSVVDTGWWPPAASSPLTPWLAGVTGDEETGHDPAHLRPYEGHGTFIAGVVRCAAPATEIRVEGFLTAGGAIFESEIVKQLIEALALGPDIINLSAGSTTRLGLPLIGFEVFYERFLSKVKGTVLVAAAGNEATRAPFWPAAFPWVVSVGAIDQHGKRADFSNFGSWVDVYAIGVDVVNAYPEGTFTCVEPPNVGEARHFEGLCRWSGTSFAAPVVVGKIAERMSRTGLSARLATDQLLHEARALAVPGVGPVL